MSNMDYANRDLEYEEVRRSLTDESIKGIILKAHPASGVTSFVKCRIIVDLLNVKSVLYLNMLREASLSEVLFKQIVQFSSPYADEFQKYIDKNLGEHKESWLSALTQCIPYIGPVLGRVVTPKAAKPIYTGDYPSAVEELLIPFLTEYAKKINTTLTIVIDSVQNLSENSFELLRNLIDCSVIRCILIETNEQSALKLENDLVAHGIVLPGIEFDQPQIKLVKEIGKLYGYSISSEDSERIVQDNHYNIHKIIKAICSYGHPIVDKPLSEWEKAIISMLHIFNLPMSVAELAAVISTGSIFAEDYNKSCYEALRQLIKRRLISTQGDDAFVLDKLSHPLVQDVLAHKAEQLIHINTAYEFIRKKNDIRHLALRYQLSKQLEFTQPEDALPYLQHLVESGEVVTVELFSDAGLKKGCRYDCLLAGIKFCRERKYSEALEWVKSIPDEDVDDDIAALKAILLNRTRNTKLAENALIDCLRKGGPPSRQNFLGAFLISNYIHAEDLLNARKVHKKLERLYPHTPMHGYLLRNAASAYSDARSELYEAATKAFQEDNDLFGYYTTLCNWGYSQCLEGKYDKAFKKLEESKIGLERFPKSNMHIIYNNLGICYLMMEDFKKAESCFSVAQKLGQTSMPRIFATINRACAQGVSGNINPAIDTLIAIESEVEAHSLDRVRQKYYPNRLMIEYLSGNQALAPLIEKAERYLDRYHPEHTKKVLQIYKNLGELPNPAQKHRWRELYSPCGLSYWYMDPLKFFPEGILYQSTSKHT